MFSKQITKFSLSEVKIKIPTQENKILSEVLEKVNNNNEIKTLWKVINVNAIDRLGMTDHGPTHFQIVANLGISIARIFEKKGIKFSITNNLGLDSNYAEVVIFLGCILHDLGMSIHRDGHEGYSLFLANNLLHDLLSFLPIEERTVVISETLHAIISHRRNGKPLTIEAGIVRIADSLDMVKGRSRVTYGRGNIDIHSISHQAIDKVEIVEGSEKPVEVKIYMSNAAGMFQIDDLMQEKLKGSGVEKYIDVVALLVQNGRETVFKEFNF